MPPISAATAISTLKGAGEATPTPWQMALDKALSWSWVNTFIFGLPIIWVNIHFACHYMAGWKSFSPFGETSRMLFGKKSEFGELILLLLLDILVFITIIFTIIIGWALMNPCAAVAAMLDFKWLSKLCSS